MREEPDPRTDAAARQAVAAAIAVHRALGPGLPESAYEAWLCRELEVRSTPFRRQIALPVRYKGEAVEAGIGSTCSWTSG